MKKHITLILAIVLFSCKGKYYPEPQVVKNNCSTFSVFTERKYFSQSEYYDYFIYEYTPIQFQEHVRQVSVLLPGGRAETRKEFTDSLEAVNALNGFLQDLATKRDSEAADKIRLDSIYNCKKYILK